MKTRTRTRKIIPPESLKLGSPSISDTSETPDNIVTEGPYAHLIDIRYLPNLDRRVYSCKEHPPPDVPEYYDLKGIVVSHFKPYHSEVGQ
jgi:hypothetical protein